MTTPQQPYSGPEIEAAIRILKEDASTQHNAALMARLDKIEGRLDRMPVKEMTPEEKAAEYDRIMSGKGPTPPAAPAGDPPPAPTGKNDPAAPTAPPPPPAPKAPATPNAGPVKAGWWDRYQGS